MVSLKVSIEDKAKAVIKEKGSILTISSTSIENCCVPIGEVMIQFGEPKSSSGFEKINLDDITLYIDKKLEFKNELVHIKPTGIGPFRTVRVEGVVYF